MSKRYTFVIDTEQYAGNFERAMCAFMTGQIGECGVGAEEKEIFETECPDNSFEDVIISEMDDNGCSRPCAICPTPGWHNDGIGNYSRGEGPYPAYLSVEIFFRREPLPHEIAFLVARGLRFRDHLLGLDGWRKKEITITGFRLIL